MTAPVRFAPRRFQPESLTAELAVEAQALCDEVGLALDAIRLRAYRGERIAVFSIAARLEDRTRAYRASFHTLAGIASFGEDWDGRERRSGDRRGAA